MPSKYEKIYYPDENRDDIEWDTYIPPYSPLYKKTTLLASGINADPQYKNLSSEMKHSQRTKNAKTSTLQIAKNNISQVLENEALSADIDQLNAMTFEAIPSENNDAYTSVSRLPQNLGDNSVAVHSPLLRQRGSRYPENYKKLQTQACLSKKHEIYQRELSKKVPNTNLSTKLFSELGNVSNHPGYYFNEGNANDCSHRYLRELFSDFKMKDEIIEQELDKRHKMAIEHKQPLPNKRDLLTEAKKPASCLSFLTVTVKGQKKCYIAMSTISKTRSNTKRREYWELLNKKTAEINETLKDEGIIYELLDDATIEVDCTIKSTLRSLHLQYARIFHRSCSEKTLLSECMKNFAIHGKELQIDGCVNYNFFPTEEKPRSKSFFTFRDENNKKHIIDQMPCCKNCRANKPAVMLLLHEAREIGIKNPQANYPSPSLGSSVFFKASVETISNHCNGEPLKTLFNKVLTNDSLALTLNPK